MQVDRFCALCGDDKKGHEAFDRLELPWYLFLMNKICINTYTYNDNSNNNNNKHTQKYKLENLCCL